MLHAGAFGCAVCCTGCQRHDSKKYYYRPKSEISLVCLLVKFQYGKTLLTCNLYGKKQWRKKFFLQEEKFFFCEHRFYCFWSYWCLRVKYHMFLFFQKFFFTESRKFLCDYVIFSPKYAIFYIYFTSKYPSISAKIFWTRKSKENLRNSIHHSFNLYTLQAA